MKALKFGSLVAGTVSGLILSSSLNAQNPAPAEEAAPASKGYCQNNTCKGKASCKGHGNDSCHGQNSCKGKGLLEASDAKSCKKAGGKWHAAKT